MFIYILCGAFIRKTYKYVRTAIWSVGGSCCSDTSFFMIIMIAFIIFLLKRKWHDGQMHYVGIIWRINNMQNIIGRKVWDNIFIHVC